MSTADTYDDGSRFWWIRGNKFFEVTPLIGYSFINNAKKVIEVLFWYFLLILFTFLTIRSVNEAVQYYFSNPTKTGVLVGSSAKNSTIQNFTFSINSSIYVMHAGNPLPTKMSKADEETVSKLFCFVSKPKTLEMHMRSELRKILFFRSSEESDWRRQIDWKSIIERMTNAMKRGGLEAKSKSWQQWTQETTENTVKKLDSFWATEKWGNVTGAMESGNGDLWKDLLFTLISFEASKPDQQEKDPRRKVEDALNMTSSQPYTPSNILYLLHAAGLRYEHLLDTINTAVKDLFYMETDLDEAQILWQDYDSDLDHGYQRLGYQVVVPEDIKKITVKLYSPYWSRFLMILDSMQNHLLSCGNQCQRCKAQPFGFTSVFTDLKINTLAAMVSMYKDSFAVTVRMANGLTQMEPFYDYMLSLMPVSRYKSETDNCYDNTLQKCLHTCLNDGSLSSCDCYSFDLQHMNLGSGRRVCETPCHKEELNKKCNDECEDKLTHPCDITLHRIEQSKVPIAHFRYQLTETNNIEDRAFYEPGLPVISFTVQIKEIFNHPKFTEVYELSFGGLIATLGGMFDFWLGLNVIGILHLAVYLIRQCRHIPNPQTKTGSTVRRILGLKSGSVKTVVVEEKKEENDTVSIKSIDFHPDKVAMADADMLEKMVEERRNQLENELAKLEKEADEEERRWKEVFRQDLEEYRKEMMEQKMKQ